MKYIIIIIAILISTTTLAERNLQKIALEDIIVVKISESEASAVIKIPSEGLRMIEVGDSIGKNREVTEITKGRIVIEEATERGTETIIIRLENGQQTIERFSKMSDNPTQYYIPWVTDGENIQKPE